MAFGGVERKSTIELDAKERLMTHLRLVFRKASETQLFITAKTFELLGFANSTHRCQLKNISSCRLGRTEGETQLFGQVKAFPVGFRKLYPTYKKKDRFKTAPTVGMHIF